MCGGGCGVLAELPCWVHWFVDVLILLFPTEIRAGRLVSEGLFSVHFLRIAVTWDMHISTRVQNLSFSRLGASTLAPCGPFWHGVALGEHGISRKDGIRFQ